jgi:hypothetical protein
MSNKLKKSGLLTRHFQYCYAIVIFLLTIFFPATAHANGMLWFVLAPFILLFLIFLSVILAIFLKLQIVKLLMGKRPKISKAYLIGTAFIEAMIMSCVIMKAYMSLPRGLIFQIANSVSFVSGEVTLWYLKKVLIEGDLFLSWYVILGVSAFITLLISILPNMKLLVEEGRSLIDTIKKPLNVIRAGLLGIIAPIVFSTLILIIIAFIPKEYEPLDTRRTVSGDKHVLNELLLQLSKARCPKLVALVLDKGADINGRSRYDGKTALQEAVYVERNLETVQLLLNRGADVNHKSSYEFTPLMFVSSSVKGDPRILRLLIQKGADVNARSSYAQTALIMASGRNKGIWSVYGVKGVELEKILLDHGADPNAKDKTGSTALMVAAHTNREDLVRLLIEYGADINAQDNAGNTALSLSTKSGHTQVRELLISHGAR